MLDKVEEILKKYEELKEIRKIYFNCFSVGLPDIYSLDLREKLIGGYVIKNKELQETVKNHMSSKIKALEKKLQDEEVKL